jgi:hypothetical protein
VFGQHACGYAAVIAIDGSTGRDTLRAIALVCSLKPSPASSSSELIAEHVFENLRKTGVDSESVRCVDYAISPGSKPIWGPATNGRSYAKRSWAGIFWCWLRRCGWATCPALAGKVAVVAVVGNEDGAHKVTADVFQALNDVGYSLPAQAGTYRNGEAMQTTDYIALDKVPDAVTSATAAAAPNAVHLAGALRGGPYPPYE